MCKEDVRIGRKKVGKIGRVDGTVNSEGVQFLPINPNRATAVCVLSDDPVTRPGSLIVIRSGSATGPLLGVLSDHSPEWRGTVEEFGVGITSSIWLVEKTAVAPTCESGEYEWIEALESL